MLGAGKATLAGRGRNRARDLRWGTKGVEGGGVGWGIRAARIFAPL